jgi:hypothetical protein
MKVIRTCNFNIETNSDSLLVENISKWEANVIAKALNEAGSKSGSDNFPHYYKVVEDNHKLYEYNPNN